MQGTLAGGRPDLAQDRLVEVVHLDVSVAPGVLDAIAARRDERCELHAAAVIEIAPIDDVVRQQGASLADLLASYDEMFRPVEHGRNFTLRDDIAKPFKPYRGARRV